MEIRLDCDGPIGVMDSGMGGISVLRELAGLLPHENFVFYGDSANAPYGSRSTEEIYQLTEQVVQKLLHRGVKAVVIACNTASSAAGARLRAEYPELPIVAIEPALKPAVIACPGGRVVVLGCTHYPFVSKVIAELLGQQVKVFDGAAGTARQLRRRLYSRRLLTTSQQPGSIQWLNSSPEPEMIELSKKLFNITI